MPGATSAIGGASTGKATASIDFLPSSGVLPRFRSDKPARSPMVNYLLVALGVLLNVGAQVALKMTGKDGGEIGLSAIIADPVRWLFNPWFILGVFLYGVSVINWLIVLTRVDLSIAYALMSTGYILTFMAGVWLFHEPVSTPRVLGLLVIIAGVILITRPVQNASLP
jgi:multidrug transporter EmrE-like cation transporter